MPNTLFVQRGGGNVLPLREVILYNIILIAFTMLISDLVSFVLQPSAQLLLLARSYSTRSHFCITISPCDIATPYVTTPTHTVTPMHCVVTCHVCVYPHLAGGGSTMSQLLAAQRGPT